MISATRQAKTRQDHRLCIPNIPTGNNSAQPLACHADLNRSQIATSSQKLRDPRFLPYAFTEHGAIKAAQSLKFLSYDVMMSKHHNVNTSTAT